MVDVRHDTPCSEEDQPAPKRRRLNSDEEIGEDSSEGGGEIHRTGSQQHQRSRDRMNVNADGACQYLKEYQWPAGLQQALLAQMTRMPIRFVILDDSGSMSISDGAKLLGDGAKKKQVTCTRWAELLLNAKFQVGLANAANALTEFRLLNNGAPCVVGRNDDNGQSYHRMMNTLNTCSPSGATPLCSHVRAIIEQIRAMEQSLRQNGHKAVIVICTDGEASDGNLAEALAPLKDLPVWVVVQLCTGEDKVVNYWNNIDAQLELDMDILDDFVSEAKEIHAHNKWITYGEPLHRLRGFGVSLKELDMLDERALTPDQIRDVCAIVLGGSVNDYPHPEVDSAAFMRAVNAANKSIPMTWSPIHKRPRNWIEISDLRSKVSSGCVVS